MKTTAILSTVLAVAMMPNLFAAEGTRTFTIDTAAKGDVLPNTVRMLTSWNVPMKIDESLLRNCEWDVREFAEWVEIMAATGGNAARDCFRDPNNRAVTDDYDFTKLIEGCRTILSLGMKPYLKLGNVPMKLSSDISNGDFSMNIRPPYDYVAYTRYNAACAKALVTAFGKDELLKWRYAVLTEYENPGWFKANSGDAELTFHHFCLLYETTVSAFSRVISPDLTFGVHAMAVTEGLWDERRFFSFVAARKLPLKFATVSFYDSKPGVFTSGFTLPKTIAHMRTAAEKAGLKNLFYGVDEGRILNGASGGKMRRDLAMRIVGDTYQAAYDARIVKQLYDSHAEHFSAWGYMSGPNTWFEGLPSVSFFVAREAAKFKGLRRLPVKAEGTLANGIECDAVAAVDEKNGNLQIMAYAFTNALHATGRVKMKFAVPAEPYRSLTRFTVDDRVNWFPQWRKDRARLGIADDRFCWSPDDPAVLNRMGLLNPKDRELFRKTLLPRYRALVQPKEETTALRVEKGRPIVIEAEIDVNSVVFMSVKK